ncbi:MAG: glycoside hydrolase family 88 protein [Opitutaceae bacterium]|nr:glycoside hydrolase family 88 protein [Opitutaceae bacterium]
MLDIPIERLDSNWEDVLVPYGAALAGAAWKDEELAAWARRWADRQVEAGIRRIAGFGDHDSPVLNGILLNDYCGLWGAPLVLGSFSAGSISAEYHAAITTVCDHILHDSLRLEGGIIAHGGSDFCRRTVWVDTLFYTASVLATGYRVTGKCAYAEEAMNQCRLHAKWLQDSTTGCFFHDAEPATGRRSSWLWSRGNGWIVMALVDTLRSCPRQSSGWSELLVSYRALTTGLLRCQHSSGLWRIMLEREDAHLETSGSAMIMAGLAAGVAEGWLEPTTRHQIMDGWSELLTWIVPATGALVGAQFPAGPGGWEVHKLSNLGERTYATGIFLRLAAELRNAGFIPVSEPPRIAAPRGDRVLDSDAIEAPAKSPRA